MKAFVRFLVVCSLIVAILQECSDRDKQERQEELAKINALEDYVVYQGAVFRNAKFGEKPKTDQFKTYSIAYLSDSGKLFEEVHNTTFAFGDAELTINTSGKTEVLPTAYFYFVNPDYHSDAIVAGMKNYFYRGVIPQEGKRELIPFYISLEPIVRYRNVSYYAIKIADNIYLGVSQGTTAQENHSGTSYPAKVRINDLESDSLERMYDKNYMDYNYHEYNMHDDDEWHDYFND